MHLSLALTGTTPPLRQLWWVTSLCCPDKTGCLTSLWQEERRAWRALGQTSHHSSSIQEDTSLTATLGSPGACPTLPQSSASMGLPVATLSTRTQRPYLPRPNYLLAAWQLALKARSAHSNICCNYWHCFANKSKNVIWITFLSVPSFNTAHFIFTPVYYFKPIFQF